VTLVYNVTLHVASNRSRASITSRGSDLIVLIEAGGFYSRIYGNVAAMMYC